jgi:hypothetical protein
MAPHIFRENFRRGSHQPRKAGSSEQNRASFRRVFGQPWKGSLDVVDELVASDYVRIPRVRSCFGARSA